MEIHVIATGRGENSFVILPDGTTMLIDLGEGPKDPKHCVPDNSKSSAAHVADYIHHFSAGLPHPDHLDYLFITHFHSDHMGSGKTARPGSHGYALSGATEIGEYCSIGKLVDRDYPDYNYPSKDWIENRCNKGFIDDYIAWTKYQVAERGSKGERFTIGSHSQFSLMNNPKAYKGCFDIFNVAGYGYITTGKGLKTRKMTEDDPENFDENMFSCSIVIRYGDFSYFTGGDTPGSSYFLRKYMNGKAVSEPIKLNPKVKFRDFESQIADLVAPVTAMKANHHGCPDTCNPYFLWKMRPQVITVFGSSEKQPAPPTLERISDPQMPCAHKVYITTENPRPSNGDELWNRCVEATGHIVIRVTDRGNRYQVYVLDSFSGDYRLKSTSANGGASKGN